MDTMSTSRAYSPVSSFDDDREPLTQNGMKTVTQNDTRALELARFERMAGGLTSSYSDNASSG
jgi:hypothetical protein